jgi:hypothetical protein
LALLCCSSKVIIRTNRWTIKPSLSGFHYSMNHRLRIILTPSCSTRTFISILFRYQQPSLCLTRHLGRAFVQIVR